METNRDRTERPVRAEVPPRDLRFAHAILLRGSSNFFSIDFQIFVIQLSLKSLIFFLGKKIGAFPHSYHIDGFPCQTHVRAQFSILFLID